MRETEIFRRALGLLALGLLGGCASLPADHGVPEVQALTEARGVTAPAPPKDTQAPEASLLLNKPIDAARAVALTLRYNPQVQGEYARLGLAAAEVYDAGRLSNPQFSVAVMTPDAAGAANQVTFGVAQRLSDLLLLPARRRLAGGEFARAQADAAQAILKLAADAEAAWYSLRGAEQVAALRAEQADAAGLAFELSGRLFKAGNVSARELAETRAAAGSEALAAATAASAVTQARAELEALLGVSAAGVAWQTAGELPQPEPMSPDADALTTEALNTRLDLDSRRREAALLADSLKEAHRWRYLGETTVGVETERGTDRTRLTGPSLVLELPIFNQGKGKLTRAEAQLVLAQSELRSLELAVQLAVRQASQRVVEAYRRSDALHNELIPARQAVYDRTREEVNYMLQSPFELIRARQLLLEARQQALEAARDYWLARVELIRAIGARRAPAAKGQP